MAVAEVLELEVQQHFAVEAEVDVAAVEGAAHGKDHNLIMMH